MAEVLALTLEDCIAWSHFLERFHVRAGVRSLMLIPSIQADTRDAAIMLLGQRWKNFSWYVNANSYMHLALLRGGRDLTDGWPVHFEDFSRCDLYGNYPL